MDHLCPALLCLHDVGECNRMSLGHIAPHDQDTITIEQILRKSGGTATPYAGTQTGYSRAVSYTCLVLDRDNTQTTIEELFD